MDQVAELLGTLAFGWCITHHGSLVVLPVITLAALLALPLEIWCIQRVCQTAYAQVHKLPSQDADPMPATFAFAILQIVPGLPARGHVLSISSKAAVAVLATPKHTP